jgi:hypothetical protein
MNVSADLLSMIQLAITPVILITGLGSLLLTMTNRLGRIVDRTRILAGQVRGAQGNETERAHLEAQLRIIYRRAGLVRRAVSMASGSMVCSCLLVVVIFAKGLTGVSLTWLIVTLFMMSLGCLLVSLVYFLRDIQVSLSALGLEVDRALRRE